MDEDMMLCAVIYSDGPDEGFDPEYDYYFDDEPIDEEDEEGFPEEESGICD